MLRQFYLCVITLNLWLVQWLTKGNASFSSVPSKKHVLASHCQLSQPASALAFDLSKPTQLLLFHGKLCFHTKKWSLLKWTGYCFCTCSVSGSDTIKYFLFHIFMFTVVSSLPSRGTAAPGKQHRAWQTPPWHISLILAQGKFLPGFSKELWFSLLVVFWLTLITVTSLKLIVSTKFSWSECKI